MVVFADEEKKQDTEQKDGDYATSSSRKRSCFDCGVDMTGRSSRHLCDACLVKPYPATDDKYLTDDGIISGKGLAEFPKSVLCAITERRPLLFLSAVIQKEKFHPCLASSLIEFCCVNEDDAVERGEWHSHAESMTPIEHVLVESVGFLHSQNPGKKGAERLEPETADFVRQYILPAFSPYVRKEIRAIITKTEGQQGAPWLRANLISEFVKLISKSSGIEIDYIWMMVSAALL